MCIGKEHDGLIIVIPNTATSGGTGMILVGEIDFLIASDRVASCIDSKCGQWLMYITTKCPGRTLCYHSVRPAMVYSDSDILLSRTCCNVGVHKSGDDGHQARWQSWSPFAAYSTLMDS